MQSLNDVVKAGKVLYLGVSDTPAWIVSKANQYARDHGLRQFSVYQGQWNASVRDFERDIIPMTIAEGMGLAPWSVLGQGTFKTEEQRAEQVAKNEGRGLAPQSESLKAVVRVLDTVAKRKGTLLTSVALAYVMHKTPYVFPLVGVRKIEHLEENIKALSLRLSEEEIREIESATDFDLGFPGNMIGTWAGGSKLNDIGGLCDYLEGQKPILSRVL